MSPDLLVGIEGLLIAGGVLGFCAYQLWSLKRLQKQKEEREKKATDEAAEQ
ncbi:MAG: hypothetical protein AAF220_14155 [Pseudomonadota bacterium]